MLRVRLIALYLVLATGSAFAQPEGNDPGPAGDSKPAGTDQQSNPGEMQQAPPPAQAASEDSPFEYESSEQISEDLSVSFPVDI